MRKCLIAIPFIFILFYSILMAQEEAITTPNAPLGKFVLFPDFPKGLNTNSPSHTISSLEFTECANVLFDKGNYVEVRSGYDQINDTILSTAPIKFLHEYKKISGNKYLLVVSSQIVATSANGISYTTHLTTMSITSKWWAVNYNDICYFGAHDGDRWNFDGTSVYGSSEIPQIKFAVVYKDKVIGANVNETYGRSKVVYSDIGYPETWPALNYIYVDRDDGDEITGIKIYRGNVYVFKKYGIYQMTGLDDGYNTNDGYYKIVEGIGALYNDTIQEKDNLLFFVSNRGVEAFDGINVKLVSERISPDIKNLAQLYTSAMSWGETTAADFADGTFVEVDTTTVNNSLSWTGIFRSTSEFVDYTANVGSFSALAIDDNNVSHIAYYDIAGGNLKYSSHSYNGINSTAEWVTSTIDSTGDVGYRPAVAIDSKNIPHIIYFDNTNSGLKYSSYTGTAWSTSVLDSSVKTGLDAHCDIAIDGNDNPHVVYADSATQYLKYLYYNGSAWQDGTIIKNFYVDGSVSLVLSTANMPCIAFTTSGTGIYISSGSGTWNYAYIGFEDSKGRKMSLALDNNGYPRVTRTNASNYNLEYSSYNGVAWTHSIIKTGVSIECESSIAIDSANETCVAYYNDTTNNLCYAHWKSTGFYSITIDSSGTNGRYPSLALGKYNKQRYYADSVAQKPYISYYNNWKESLAYYPGNFTPYYVSSKYNATTAENNWIGWGEYRATENLPPGVTAKHYVRTATTESGLDTADWQLTTNGSTAKSNIGAHAQYKIEFISSVSTPTARIDDVEIAYTVDSQNKPLIATVQDRRYWLSGAIRPEIDNNVIYCLDQNNNWTKFTNIRAGAFVNFNNDFLIGSSTYTAKIYKYSDTFTTDDGASIAPFIRTKDYDFGTWTEDKYNTDLWISAEPSVVYSSTTINYYTNKKMITSYTDTLSLTANSTYTDMPLSGRYRRTIDRARFVGWRISNFDKLYGILFRFGIHAEREE